MSKEIRNSIVLLAKNINNAIHVIFQCSDCICVFDADKRYTTQAFLAHCRAKVCLFPRHKPLKDLYAEYDVAGIVAKIKHTL